MRVWQWNDLGDPCIARWFRRNTLNGMSAQIGISISILALGLVGFVSRAEDEPYSSPHPEERAIGSYPDYLAADVPQRAFFLASGRTIRKATRVGSQSDDDQTGDDPWSC